MATCILVKQKLRVRLVANKTKDSCRERSRKKTQMIKIRIKF